MQYCLNLPLDIIYARSLYSEFIPNILIQNELFGFGSLWCQINAMFSNVIFFKKIKNKIDFPHFRGWPAYISCPRMSGLFQIIIEVFTGSTKEFQISIYEFFNQSKRFLTILFYLFIHLFNLSHFFTEKERWSKHWLGNFNPTWN